MSAAEKMMRERAAMVADALAAEYRAFAVEAEAKGFYRLAGEQHCAANDAERIAVLIRALPLEDEMVCRNNAAAKARKRDRLFREQHGECEWCGGIMELKQFVHGETPDEDAATLQHMVTKLMPDRKQVYNERRIVLMHHRCCMKYNRAVEQMVGIDVLHARAHSTP